MKWSVAQFSILLAIALTIWLGPSIFGGKALMPLDILRETPPFSAASEPSAVHNPLIADMLYENLAWKQIQRECFRNGEWPLWNPYSFCGHPIYTTGQTSTFYPLNFIFVVAPLLQAYAVFTWLHLLAGGVFTYLFFRRIGVSGFGASVGGIMFGLCTFFAVRLIWPMLLGSAIWLPLMLLWIDRAADTRAGRFGSGWLSGAVLFALPILSGFFEIAFYVFAACGLYTLFMGIRLARMSRSCGTGKAETQGRWMRPAVLFFAKVGAVTGLAAVLAAPQLLPFFEVMKRNVRAGEVTYKQARKLAMTPAEALTGIVPDALGNPAQHKQFDLRSRTWQPIRTKGGGDAYYLGSKNYVEATSYVGLLPLAFIVFSLKARGERRLYFWILAGLGLAMAFVTPLYRIFFALVPGTDQVRSPWRWSLLTWFACTYLAAIGADCWYERLSGKATRVSRMVAGVVVSLAAGFAVLMLGLSYHPAPLLRLANGIMGTSTQAAATFASASDLAGVLWSNGTRLALFALAAVGVVSLPFWRTWGKRGIAAVSIAAAALVAFDLGQATYRFNTHSDPAILDRRPEVLKYLQEQASREVFRVGRFGWQKFLYPNLPAICGLQEFGGYDSIVLTDFARYMQAIEPLKLLPYNIVASVEKIPSLDSPLYALLNVRYLLCVKPLKHPDYEPVNVPGNLLLYRLKDTKLLPRAFLVNQVTPVADLDGAIGELQSGRIKVREHAVVQIDADGSRELTDADPGPLGEAKIVSYRSTSVRVETRASGRQFLVLCDMNYPGWRAYVDGQLVRVFATDGIFRGVSVPAGTHTVEFRFSPVWFRVGAIAALVCLAGLIGVEGFQGWRRLRVSRAC